MKYIPRTHYLNKIKPYIGKDIIKVLTGQRRVGKSYMMFQIIDLIKEENPDAEIIYINKELHEYDSIKTDKNLINYINENTRAENETTSIFIDEIQDIENFEKALRSLFAEKKYDIFITGSNANLLSGELATLISGRYIQIKIFGLSYPEFLEFHKIPNNTDSLSKYIRFGGLPFLINLPLEEYLIYDYLKNIYSTILYKDIISRYSVRNSSFLERLVEYTVDNTGSIVSAKKISDFLKSQQTSISPNIVLNYLGYLVSAFFLFRVKRSDIAGKKIFEIGEKYYFEDIGLRNSIAGFKPQDMGKILENIVFIHLCISGYEITAGELSPGEIDFVCVKENKKLYVQVAYMIPDEKTFTREFGNLIKIQDNYPKIVVSMDEIISQGHEGIEHMHILDFISEYR